MQKKREQIVEAEFRNRGRGCGGAVSTLEVTGFWESGLHLIGGISPPKVWEGRICRHFYEKLRRTWREREWPDSRKKST